MILYVKGILLYVLYIYFWIKIECLYLSDIFYLLFFLKFGMLKDIMYEFG